MSEDRNRILDLLSTGKITVEEASQLLDALEARAAQAQTGQSGDSGQAAAGENPAAGGNPAARPGQSGSVAGKPAGPAKYMYVKVVSTNGDNVNVKVPLGLVRAGLKLTSLIPQPAVDQINKSMAQQGMSIDLMNLTPKDLEELIESLREMEVNVDNAVTGDNVRVYCA